MYERKSIKFDFIYEKVILDYHNVLFNLKHCSQKVKLIIKKKHANFFKVLITDLKSVRKTLLKNIYSQTRYFQKNFLMVRQHCGQAPCLNVVYDDNKQKYIKEN